MGGGTLGILEAGVGHVPNGLLPHTGDFQGVTTMGPQLLSVLFIKRISSIANFMSLGAGVMAQKVKYLL